MRCKDEDYLCGFCLEYLVVLLPFTLRRNTFEGGGTLFWLGCTDFEMPVNHVKISDEKSVQYTDLNYI